MKCFKNKMITTGLFALAFTGGLAQANPEIDSTGTLQSFANDSDMNVERKLWVRRGLRGVKHSRDNHQSTKFVLASKSSEHTTRLRRGTRVYRVDRPGVNYIVSIISDAENVLNSDKQSLNIDRRGHRKG